MNSTEKLVKLFDKAPIKASMGMSLEFNEDNHAVFVMPYNPKFDHALNDIHGGVIATLLDNAGWFTVAAHYDCWVVTVEFTVRLLEPGRRDNLTSEGRIIRAGKRMATAEMEVYAPNERLVAVGSGTFVTTSESI